MASYPPKKGWSRTHVYKKMCSNNNRQQQQHQEKKTKSSHQYSRRAAILHINATLLARSMCQNIYPARPLLFLKKIFKKTEKNPTGCCRVESCLHINHNNREQQQQERNLIYLCNNNKHCNYTTIHGLFILC